MRDNYVPHSRNRMDVRFSYPVSPFCSLYLWEPLAPVVLMEQQLVELMEPPTLSPDIPALTGLSF